MHIHKAGQQGGEVGAKYWLQLLELLWVFAQEACCPCQMLAGEWWHRLHCFCMQH